MVSAQLLILETLWNRTATLLRILKFVFLSKYQTKIEFEKKENSNFNGIRGRIMLFVFVTKT